MNNWYREKLKEASMKRKSEGKYDKLDMVSDFAVNSADKIVEQNPLLAWLIAFIVLGAIIAGLYIIIKLIF